jgi:hypothetical protein
MTLMELTPEEVQMVDESRVTINLTDLDGFYERMRDSGRVDLMEFAHEVIAENYDGDDSRIFHYSVRGLAATWREQIEYRSWMIFRDGYAIDPNWTADGKGDC